MYGLRQGFRDGMPGLILSLLYTYYTFVKYAKLWERTLPFPLRGEGEGGGGMKGAFRR
jgi:hypothetical protein